MTSSFSFFLKALTAAVLLGGALAPDARAHVSLEWPAAMAASSYKAIFGIGHGCGASPTRQVSVDIPAGVRGARPMPRPGWSVTIERAPLPEPYMRHGRKVTEDVTRITWTARTPEDMLDSAHFGEFALVATLARQPGPVYWPVRQVCLEGRQDWVQVPAPGQKPSALQFPAPVLEILPAAHGGGHTH